MFDEDPVLGLVVLGAALQFAVTLWSLYDISCHVFGWCVL
jgi:hypothetical protein